MSTSIDQDEIELNNFSQEIRFDINYIHIEENRYEMDIDISYYGVEIKRINISKTNQQYEISIPPIFCMIQGDLGTSFKFYSSHQWYKIKKLIEKYLESKTWI